MFQAITAAEIGSLTEEADISLLLPKEVHVVAHVKKMAGKDLATPFDAAVKEMSIKSKTPQSSSFMSLPVSMRLGLVSLLLTPLLAILLLWTPGRYSQGYPAEYVSELVHNRSQEYLFPEVLAAAKAPAGGDGEENPLSSFASSSMALLNQYLPEVDLNALYSTGMNFFQSSLEQLQSTVTKLTSPNESNNETLSTNSTPADSTTAVSVEVTGTPADTTTTTPTTPTTPNTPPAAPTLAYNPTRLLKGVTAIVTGSTSGLGKQMATELYGMGAHVVVASRNRRKCRQTIREIKKTYNESAGKLEVGILDTSDLESVASFARSFLANHSQLHYLINNAGIHYISTAGDPLRNMSLPMVSPQGYDLAFATNYLGHFLLTELLLPLIAETSSYGVVVNIASSFHYLSDGAMLKVPSKKGALAGAEGGWEDEDEGEGGGMEEVGRRDSGSSKQSGSEGRTGAGTGGDGATSATATDDSATATATATATDDSATATATATPATTATTTEGAPTPRPPPKNRWWAATGLLPDLGFLVDEKTSWRSRPQAFVPSSQDTRPAAARGDINDRFRHRYLSYGNNKLAQVLHAKELQRRLNANNVKVRTASVCPGFVATNILPDDAVGRVAAALAFDVEQGNLASMCSLFDPALTGGEFVGHFQNWFTAQRWLIRAISALGLREVFINVVVVWVLLFQKRTYGRCQVEAASMEGEDVELARALFDWSKNEVSQYLGVVVE